MNPGKIWDLQIVEEHLEALKLKLDYLLSMDIDNDIHNLLYDESRNLCKLITNVRRRIKELEKRINNHV